MRQSLKNAGWALLLFACSAVVLLIPYWDVQTGRAYARDACALGMREADAESYKLYALCAREKGLEVPSPTQWAKDRFERLEFRPGSELEKLKQDVWLPALVLERERARQEFLAREREGSPD